MRLIIIFDLTIRHTSKQLKRVKSIESKLTVIQNRCFRIVIEVYKTTFISILETEIHISSIAIQLNRLQKNARRRLTHCSSHIKKFCKAIAKKLREARERRRNVDFTSSTHKTIWVISSTRLYQKSLTSTFFWKKLTKNERADMKKYVVDTREHSKITKNIQNKKWQKYWIRYKQTLCRVFIVIQQ